MPKPNNHVAGSGMHLNFSMYKEGVTLFEDYDGVGITDYAKYFMGGIMAHARGLCAITNPIVNSYKRLVPGYEAPSYITWSTSNRSVLVRIPASRGKGTRVELRSPDPCCNPYLEMALCLASGLDGIKKGLKPAPAYDENVYELSQAELDNLGIDCLPASLEEAIKAAEADPFVRETLGDHVYNNYIEGKKAEWDAYRKSVSEWEIKRYMVNY